MTTRQQLIDGFEMIMREGERVMSRFGDDDWKIQAHDEEGGWNRKQVYAHLTASAEITPQFAPRLLEGAEGGDAQTGIDINALNAQLVGAKEGLGPQELMQAFKVAHEKLIEFVKTVPEDQFQRPAKFGQAQGTVAEVVDSILVLHGLAHIYNAGGSA